MRRRRSSTRCPQGMKGTKNEVEVYPGTHHGFAFPKRPVYDRDAAERHWERLLALYKRNLVVSGDALLLPLLIAFPVFDPIAIAIGPIAIRWYALAYIGGIVLGWIYARALIKNEKLWGGPAPITLLADRRLHPLGHRRHHRRRPHRLCAVLQSAVLHPASGRDPRAVEGRHVLPWRLHGLRGRGDVVRAQERHLRFSRSATSPPRSDRSACSSGASPISSTASCGAGRPTPTCPGR